MEKQRWLVDEVARGAPRRIYAHRDGAEEAGQRVKKIPVRRSTEGRQHKACMENTGYFSLARMLLLKAT